MLFVAWNRTMGKSLRRVQRKLNARRAAMLETQRRITNDLRVNPKIRANVEKAFKLPGSQKLH